VGSAGGGGALPRDVALASYRPPGATGDRAGVVVGDRIVDLAAAVGDRLDPADARGADWLRAPGRLELFLALHGWPDLVAAATDTAPAHALADVTLRPPVQRPEKIIGVGLNYVSHADEAERAVPEYPVLFAKFANTLTGPHDDVPIPRASHRIDYEGELAVVIGHRTHYATRDEADAAIAGYAVANDVSARDYQFRTKEMLQGKSFDHFCPLGPVITRPRAAGDLGSLALTTRVNGEQRQSAKLGEMLFDVPFLVEYLSAIMTLEPGDVILTGTPAGIGGGMRPRRWLRDGDRVDIEIAEIGRIGNTFVAGRA
jgi:acylpyruvate hydrolase